MKITIFTGSLSGGGAERVACNLATFLYNHGNEVEFLTFGNDDKSYYYDPHINRINLLEDSERGNAFKESFIRIVRFVKYLVLKKQDVYIVTLPVTIIMLLSFSFLTKSKIIASERCDPQKLPSKQQKGLKFFCKNADGWIFQTPEVMNWYLPSLGSTKRIVIPNAINPSFLENQLDQQKEKVIITSGRLKKQKNHKLLIDSFALIASKFIDYKLLILGEGGLRNSLESLIEEYRLNDRVTLLGYVDNVKERLSRASVFVLSSLYEGMPNALIEAMALGLPCISTDCDGGGARYLINDGENGLLVPNNDVNALANAIDKILSNEEFAQKLGRNAEKVKEDLHPDKIYGCWLQFIEDIVQTK